MKRIFLAATAALLCLAPLVAFAQGPGELKPVQLVFSRQGNPPTPFAGGANASPTMNGGKCGSGVACMAQDTSQAIPIWDHILNRAETLRALTPAGTSVDTLAFFGTLRLTSTVGTIDSIKVRRDVSADGLVWTAVDSLSYSIPNIVSGTILAQAVGDSLGLKLTSVTSTIDGATIGSGAVSFYVNPLGVINGATRLAFKNFHYIRFRVSMSEADNIAAGLNGGVSATFSYPAVGSGFNK
jgi:hypothetical protein